jgi:preprotein translocase subunit SecE
LPSSSKALRSVLAIFLFFMVLSLFLSALSFAH